MPVEFLTDEEVAAYGRFGGPPSRAELERFFFLNDRDRELVRQRRRPQNRLGFALQLGTVRAPRGIVGLSRISKQAAPCQGSPGSSPDALRGRGADLRWTPYPGEDSHACAWPGSALIGPCRPAGYKPEDVPAATAAGTSSLHFASLSSARDHAHRSPQYWNDGLSPMR
jgi:Domain of unknown function (DUF4158)